jgi:hypothetical protein
MKQQIEVREYLAAADGDVVYTLTSLVYVMKCFNSIVDNSDEFIIFVCRTNCKNLNKARKPKNMDV